MTQPGSVAAQVLAGQNGFDQLAVRMRDVERTMLEMQHLLVQHGNLNLTPGNSIFISGGDVQSSDFDGDLSVPSTGTTGWALGGPHSAAVLNNLFLRPGSITNDALSNPVQVAVGHGHASNFAVNGSVVATCSISVPAGFTTALVFATAQCNARNVRSVQDALQVAVRIDGTDPGLLGTNDAVATASVHPEVSVTRAGARLLTGLASGHTIVVDNYAQTLSATAWTADTSNIANVDATVVFLR